MRRLLAILLTAAVSVGPAFAQATSPFNGVSVGAAPGCQPSGTFVLSGNGAGGCKNVTIGSGLAFDGTTLTSTGSGGSVTSVGLAAPGIFSVSGSPVTTAGTLTLGLANENANLVWAGPTTGSPAAPTFRALVTADLPAGTGTVTSVGLSAPGIFSVSGSPVTASGTLGLTLATQSANLVWAGPTSGGAASPTFRSLVDSDLPANVAFLDRNQSWTAAQREPLVTVSPSGATFTPNFDTGQSFSMTLPHASCPCTLANPSTTPVSGQVGVIQWLQDSTGGASITTWGSFYYAPGGTSTLTFTTTASHQDIWSYVAISPTEIVLLPGATDVFH